MFVLLFVCSGVDTHRVPRLRRLFDEVVDGVTELRVAAGVGVCAKSKQAKMDHVNFTEAAQLSNDNSHIILKRKHAPGKW